MKNESITNTVKKLTNKHILSTLGTELVPNLYKNQRSLLQNLNEAFALHEVRGVLRDIKKHSASGEDKITYEMLQKLPKCSTKAVLKLFNQIWLKNDFSVSW